MRELIAQLAATPRTVAHLVAEASGESLDRADEGAWSARTILAHLRDLEHLVFRMRLARLLVEAEPVFPDYDESGWEGVRSRARDRKEQLLGDFVLQRQASVALIRALEPDQLARAGRHEAGRPWTVESWLAHWVEHDRVHVAQLELTLGETLHQVLERRARPADADNREGRA